MRRQDKYPDTQTFHYHNANPKNRFTGDCSVRAISTATGVPYNEVVRALAELQIKTGFSFGERRTIDRYLQSLGWTKQTQPRKLDGTKYTGQEFCKARRPSAAVVSIGTHHITAVIDGKVWDTWDCSFWCVGNYWTKG